MKKDFIFEVMDNEDMDKFETISQSMIALDIAIFLVIIAVLSILVKFI